MLKDREKLYQIYHTMLSLALTWAFVLVIDRYYELQVPIILTAVISFIPPLLIYLADLNKKNAATYLIIVGIIPILAFIFWINKFNPMHWLSKYANWLGTYDGSKELYKAQFSIFTIIWVALLSAILFYLITKKQIAKVILAIAIMVTMIVLSSSNITVNKAVVGISIFYILSIIVEVYGIIYSKKAGRHEKKEGILYLAPICLLLAVLSISLPSKSEPIQWKTIKNLYYSVKEQIEVWSTDWNYYFGKSDAEFGLSLSGYSEDSGQLGDGGGVKKDNNVALLISGMDKGKSVYLIGSVSDIYTGSSWEKSHTDAIAGEREYLLDYKEMFYALSRQELKYLQDNRYQFLARKSISIEYDNIKTKTFFHPLKMCRYDFKNNYKRIYTDNAQITFKKARGKGTSYQNIFYEMNLKSEEFQNMLRTADAFSYETVEPVNEESAEWIKKNIVFYDNSEDMFSAEDYKTLEERAGMIQAQCTVLPEGLPDRVRKLAEDITAEYDTTYDKLKAIETYLLGYKYTLSPEPVPKGQDFIDYFLFESKEGYCTSFATAMAVLSRCIGVPTRYVEGFVAKFDTKDDTGKYLVRNSQAHAWAEAYIEGVGWIPFEATASYYDTRYTDWVIPTVGPRPVAPYQNPYENYLGGDYTPYQIDLNRIKLDGKDKSSGIINGVIIILTVIICTILICTTYYNILKIRYKKYFNKSDYNKKMYMLFLRILKLLKREGYYLGQQETILMLSNRIRGVFRYEGVTFSDVANIFMKYRYAEVDVTKKDFDKVVIYHQGLFDKKRKEDNRFKVWLEEFLFLAKKSNR